VVPHFLSNVFQIFFHTNTSYHSHSGVTDGQLRWGRIQDPSCETVYLRLSLGPIGLLSRLKILTINVAVSSADNSNHSVPNFKYMAVCCNTIERDCLEEAVTQQCPSGFGPVPLEIAIGWLGSQQYNHQSINQSINQLIPPQTAAVGGCSWRAQLPATVCTASQSC